MVKTLNHYIEMYGDEKVFIECTNREIAGGHDVYSVEMDKNCITLKWKPYRE
ncbi:MAG: hypothetical protein WC877_00320 [Dehalococcoidales bacterium]